MAGKNKRYHNHSPGASSLTNPPLSWLLILGALIAFAPMSIDMYLPSLPTIATEFGAEPSAAQFTLASFFDC